MSNSLSDDYFSFMSRKGDPKATDRRPPPKAALQLRESDTIEFEEESQMEVEESIVSDTMIQRVFKRFSKEP